jgi:hypothetical protein
MKRLLLLLLPLLLCGAASFNGTTEGAGTSSSITAVGTNLLTVSYWVNHSATNVGVVLEQSANAGLGTQALPRFAIYRGDSGQTSEDFAMKANGWRFEWISGNTLNVWKHRVVVYDMTTSAGDVRVYTNGIVAATTIRLNTLVSTTVGFTTAQSFFVGARNNGTSPHMSGFLQDVAIYAGEVSAAEAYALGARRMSPEKVRSAKLLYYWPFSAGENPANSPDLVGGTPINSGTKSIVQEQAPTYRK